MKRNDTILLTSGEIADWFVGADKTGLPELDEGWHSRARHAWPR